MGPAEDLPLCRIGGSAMVDNGEHAFLAALRTHCHELAQHAATAVHHVETRIFDVLGDASGAAAQASPDGAASPLGMHDVRMMIEEEVRASGIGADSELDISAALSLKVTTGVATGGELTVSVWGIGGGIGAGRSSTDTRTVTLTFTPGTGTGSPSKSYRVVGRSSDTLAEELADLKTLLPDDDAQWTKIEIDVDFMLASDAEAHLVVSAKFQDSSTHTLRLTITKSD
jgi:hypothetical protein